VRNRKRGISYRECGMRNRNATFPTENAACATENAAFPTENAACATENVAFPTENATCATENMACGIPEMDKLGAVPDKWIGDILTEYAQMNGKEKIVNFEKG